MSKINELRSNRAKTWEQAKAFLDSHRNEKGILSAEDTEVYERMEQEIVNLGHEIDRQERMDTMERELNMPVNQPITEKPDNRNREERKRPAVLPMPTRRLSGIRCAVCPLPKSVTHCRKGPILREACVRQGRCW